MATDPFAGIMIKKEKTQEEELSRGSIVERSAESPFAGLGLNGAEVKDDFTPETIKPVSEITEPKSALALAGEDLVSTGKRLGSELLDLEKENLKTLFSFGGPAKLALGGIETVGRVGVDALSWIPSKLGLVAATGMGKAIQTEQQVNDDKEVISDQAIAQRAKEIEDTIGGFAGSLLGEVKTPVAQRNTKFIGDIFETGLAPLKVASDFYAKKGYPNFGNMLALTGEVLAFKAIHAGTNKIKGKKVKTKIQEAESVVDLEQIVKDIKEDAVVQAELNAKMLDVINPERMALKKNAYQVKLEELKTSKTLKGKEKTNAIKAEKKKFKSEVKEAKASIEAFKNHKELIKEAKKEQMSLEELIQERLERNQQLLDATDQMSSMAIEELKGQEISKPTKSALSQRGQGFESDVRLPKRSPEIESAFEGMSIDPQIKLKNKVELLPEESIPGERSVYQIITDPQIKLKNKVELLPEESIPGERSVYQIITDPLKSETGAVTIPRKLKKLKEKVPAVLRENVREIGRAAESQGIELGEFLKTRGLNKTQIKAFKKYHELTKIENPLRSALEISKDSPKDFKPFELKPNENQVNISKDANQAIKIGESDLAILKTLPAGRINLTKFFKSTDFMFDRYEKLRPILHQAREAEAAVSRELRTASKHVKELEQTFPKKKLREEAGAAWFKLNKFGQDAMEKLGIEVKERPEYSDLKLELDPLFKDLFDRLNEQRVKLGKRKIPEQADYLSFFSKEGLYSDIKNLVKGKKEINRHNLVMEDLPTIRQRQSIPVKDSTAFHHLKRTGLKAGIKLELDPLKIYARYLNESLRHIHISPINAFMKELLSSKLTDPKTGRSSRFKDVNPSAAMELSSWNNKLAGLSNLPLPKTFEKLANKGMHNLTVAQLFGNARTAMVQSTALLPTAVKYGYAKTGKGIADMVFNKKNAPIKESSALETAVMDAAVNDMGRAIAGSKFDKASIFMKEKSAWLMSTIDYAAREATFRTVWNSLEPAVKDGSLSRKEAIRIADGEVVRTQGSGLPMELSPIQRNVIGKMATLWQTFTINHINFIAKDVLGINNPKLKPKETIKRVSRYIGGMIAVNSLFEQGLGIQSPLPAPEQALINGLKDMKQGDSYWPIYLKSLMEITEAFPFGGSVKFGSSPVGPLIDHANNITKAISGSSEYHPDMLEKAIEGDPRSGLALGELIGKTLGVPGTAQTTKYLRGRKRGESMPRSLIGKLPKKRTSSGSTSRTRRPSRKSRSSRSSR